MFDYIENLEVIKSYIEKFRNIQHLFERTEEVQLKTFVDYVCTHEGLSDLIIKHADKRSIRIDRSADCLKKSIINIGIPAVQNLLIFYISKPFFIPKRNFELIELDLYWKHCLGTSVAGKLIASKVCPKDSYKIFTYGLIHDLGTAILNQCLPDKLKLVIDLMRQGVDQLEAEKVIFEGIDHLVVGSWICKKLNFNDELIDVISNHHIKRSLSITPSPSEILSLADLISTEYYQRLLGKPLHSQLYEVSNNFIFATKKMVLDASISLPNEVAKIEKLYL